MHINNFRYTIGNHKIGRDTLIFNMGSATFCPSKEKKLCTICNAGKTCYAFKSERQYPGVLEHRVKQRRYWLDTSINDIILDIATAIHKHRKIKYIRFNESGDFHTQQCVNKLRQVAKSLSLLIPERNIIFYGYTARRDLHYGLFDEDPNLIINGSGFFLDNRFIAVEEYSGENPVCGGKCSSCILCKIKDKRTIEIKYH